MRPIRCCCCYCSGPILSATHLHPAASPVLPRPGKTRLLVTHQRQFLPGCDMLLVMRGGRIALKCVDAFGVLPKPCSGTATLSTCCMGTCIGRLS